MAPTNRNIRTYEKKAVNSADALNALLAQNLTKRLIGKKKPKVKLKQLPPRTQVYLSDDSHSLKVVSDDSFDKVVKGKVFNPVRVVKKFVKINSSESDASKSQSPQVSVSYHSPIMTRKRLRQTKVVITEQAPSPSPQTSSVSLNETSTLDKPVDVSLDVEKECKKANFNSYRSLSYIHLPKIEENKVMHHENTRMEASFEPLLSDTFRERQTVVHSSTPCLRVSTKNMVAESISPICRDTSDLKLIKKSYDEIRKWDSSFPDMGRTPPGPVLRSSTRKEAPMKIRRRKLSTAAAVTTETRKTFDDWKLNCPPKVYLQVDDIVDCEEDGFKGFSQLEQSQAEKLLEEISVSEGSHKCQNESTRPKVRRSSRLNGAVTQPQSENGRRSKVRKKSKRLTGKMKTRSSGRIASQRYITLRRNKIVKDTRKKESSSSGDSETNIPTKPNVSYCSEELNRDLEINLPNVDGDSCFEITPEPKSLSVELDKFETFMANYFNQNKSEVEDGVTNTSHESTTSSSKVTNSPLASDSMKIHQSLKTYQNIYHDHSYSSSPMPKHLVSVSPKAKDSKSLLDCDIIESSVLSNRLSSPKNNSRDYVTLKPGKSYRRSLSVLRRSSIVVSNSDGKSNWGRTRLTSFIVPVTIEESPRTSTSILQTYARRKSSYVQTEPDIIDLDESVGSLSLKSRHSSSALVVVGRHHENDQGDNDQQEEDLPLVTAKEVVLRKCGQVDVLPFEKCYPRSALEHCQKIGEGVYGEVFLYRNQNGGTSVMKIIPIEGDLIVNGEKQKKYEEIVTEIIISMELSKLRNSKMSRTSGFSEVKTVNCVKGYYPDTLLDLWELYDENHGSENDSPQIFPPSQQYVVLELANGGKDVESYVFNSALQALSMFKQTACALAVAEQQLNFEHRDLHWGNILITSVDKNKNIQFRLNGKEIEVPSHGVEVAIIDFTLSRMECDGVVIYNDLSLDNDLFTAKGDYQFEIYRLMQQSNGNNWKIFNPYTNILWLHYVLDKAVTSALRYKNTRSKIHRESLGKLKKLKDDVLTFHSAVEFVVNNFI